MTLRWESTRDKLVKLRTTLHEQRGVRNQLLKSKKEETDLLIEAQKTKQQSEKAHLFLLAEITNRRKQAVSAIENIGSAALKMMYGDGYSIQFYDFEDVRKAGSNSFKMEVQMLSPYGKKNKPLVTKLFGSRGGGGIEVSATSLQFGALDWLQYEGPMLLDETFKSMSKDAKIYQVAKWLHAIQDVTGRQVIFATHMGDIFGKNASKILYVQNDNPDDYGKSLVREIGYDECKALQLEAEKEAEAMF